MCVQIVEMIERGWTDSQIKDLMGGNLMRVMDEVDAVSESLQKEKVSSAIWEQRKDLPAQWGGPNEAYYPYAVRDAQEKLFVGHDEL